MNPLFYTSIGALDRDSHGKLEVSNEADRFEFARAAHLIPALVEEFSAAAADMTIAFLPGSPAPSPVFVVGLTPGENLLVSDTGTWVGGYVPAYLRRYPFIIGEVSGADPVLCVDAQSDMIGAAKGVPLFDADGEPTQITQAAVTLCEQFRVGAIQTEAFCALLNELGLLRQVTFDIKRPTGETIVVHGLLTLDETAFNALPDEKFIELRTKGYLAPIYAHLMSLRMLERLNDRDVEPRNTDAQSDLVQPDLTQPDTAQVTDDGSEPDQPRARKSKKERVPAGEP